MKQKVVLIIFVLSFLSSSAQQVKGIYGDTNWMLNWTNFKPATTEYKEPNAILSGVIDKTPNLVATTPTDLKELYMLPIMQP